MESGDLDRAITVRGGNDLTALAECLDAMRVAFRAQQEREAQTYAANQALISEMSHDLRTPSTTAASLYRDPAVRKIPGGGTAGTPIWTGWMKRPSRSSSWQVCVD